MSTPTPTTYAGGLSRSQVVTWRNAIFVVFLLPGLLMASWVSRLPAVRDALDIRIDQVGILIFGVAAGSIIGLLFSSHIVARLGARATILWGVVLASAGVAIAGIGATVGPVFAVVFIGLLLFGCSSGITDVAMNVSGAANARTLKRSIMPIFHAFFSFGTMIGAGLGALAELLGVPIAVHLGIIAVITIVTGLSVNRLIQSEHVIEEGQTPIADDDHSTKT